MTPRIACFAVVAFAAGVAIAATDKPTGPLQLVNVGLQPVRVSPNPQGALLLSEATGCYVEFVGPGQGEAVYQFRIGPTAKVSAIDKCLESLRRQPGITAVNPSR
jgi:hypothetical protein